MNGRDFKKNRSDSYQPNLVEFPYSPEMLADFAESQGMTGRLNSAFYNEELFELQKELKVELWRIIDTQLTPRQREVLHLCADGYTQIEVAKKLKVNQSSVTKSINGNCDYRNGRRLYGGSKRKLRKIASKDPKIQSILRKIAELQEE